MFEESPRTSRESVNNFWVRANCLRPFAFDVAVALRAAGALRAAKRLQDVPEYL
jgi:hypothetical protein